MKDSIGTLWQPNSKQTGKERCLKILISMPDVCRRVPENNVQRSMLELQCSMCISMFVRPVLANYLSGRALFGGFSCQFRL